MNKPLSFKNLLTHDVYNDKELFPDITCTRSYVLGNSKEVIL